MCAVSLMQWRLCNVGRAWCAGCAMSVTSWHLFTRLRSLCVVWCGVTCWLAASAAVSPCAHRTRARVGGPVRSWGFACFPSGGNCLARDLVTCGLQRACLACFLAACSCALPCAGRLLSVRRSAFPSMWSLLQLGLHTRGFTGRLRGLRGGGRRTVLIVPAAAPPPPAAEALNLLRVAPTQGRGVWLSLAGLFRVSLWLRALRWFCACRSAH